MARWNKGRRSQKGSLLMEVLLAISILSVSLTLIVHSFLSGLRASVYTKDYSIALSLLQNKLFELKQKNPVSDSLDESGDFDEPYQKFKYHLKTESLDETQSLNGLAKATLDVSWVSGKSKKDISLSTYLFKLQEE